MVSTNPFPQFIPENYQVEPLAGDASTRRYSRVRTSAGTQIFMEREPFDESQDTFLQMQQVLGEGGIRVPRVLAVDGSKGFVLLEDLGDISLQDIVHNKGITSSESQLLYKQALAILRQLHQLSIDKFPLRFDYAKLSWEMDFAIQHVFLEFYKEQLASGKSCESLSKELHDLTQILAQQAEVPTHRDYHSRNLMVHQGELCVIDFQDARMGRSQYDLVSLLGDSYVQIPWELECTWVKQFYQQLGIQNCSWEEYWQLYLLQGIQRGFKACGTFASQWNLKGNDRYIEYLIPTLRRVLFLAKQCPSFTPRLACWIERVLP